MNLLDTARDLLLALSEGTWDWFVDALWEIWLNNIPPWWLVDFWLYFIYDTLIELNLQGIEWKWNIQSRTIIFISCSLFTFKATTQLSQFYTK